VTYQLTYKGNSGVKYRAKVLPFHETEKYSGDVSIPYKVRYQNIDFQITGYNQDSNYHYPFDYCPELTSLSISSFYAPPINSCKKLTKVEYCKGVVQATMIQNCSLLEELTYPETCSYVVIPYWCRKIKSLTFNYKRKLEMWVLDENYLSSNMPLLKDIYFASSTPPMLSGKIPTVNANVKIHIPVGSLEAYQNSDWKDWTLVEDQPAVGQNDLYWDYCGSSTNQGGSFSHSWLFYYGDNNTEFAMRMPSEEMEQYKGSKISAIEFYVDALD